MYQNFIVFSGFSKISGTLGRARLLSVPGFYRFLWFFEKIWYTFESETLRCTRLLYVFSGFSKNPGTLRRIRLLGVPDSSGFSRKSGRFFVEGRTFEGGWTNNKNCHFLIFLISFLALAADKTPRMTSCQRILGAWKCL